MGVQDCKSVVSKSSGIGSPWEDGKSFRHDLKIVDWDINKMLKSAIMLIWLSILVVLY